MPYPNVTIDQPEENAPVYDGTTCVLGRGAIDGAVVAESVAAKIYSAGSEPTPTPSSPPGDAALTTPNSSGNWSFGMLSGAVVSNTTQNALLTWVKYPGDSWQATTAANFFGYAGTGTPNCGSSSSSSSSSSG